MVKEFRASYQDHKTILEKVKNFYQKLYKKEYQTKSIFLENLPKVSEASKAAMEADLTLEELQDTMKSKGMKDTAPGCMANSGPWQDH